MKKTKGFSRKPPIAQRYCYRFRGTQYIRISIGLEHFEEWFKACYQCSIYSAILPSGLYKLFFLNNVSLYPNPRIDENFLPENLDVKIGLAGYKNLNKVSYFYTFSIIMAVIRWQRDVFNVNPRDLLTEFIPFYRNLRRLEHNREFTYQKAIMSESVLRTFRRFELPGTNCCRDLVILLMTWTAGCTPKELVKFALSDIESSSALDWVYVRHDKQGITTVELAPFTVLSIFDLVLELRTEVDKQSERLLNERVGYLLRALSKKEIEIIIERHFRFAEALYGYNPHKMINAFGESVSDYSPAEENMFSEALEQIYNRILDDRQCQTLPIEEFENDDWDLAIQRARKGERVLNRRDAEHQLRDDSDEQADWDDAILKKT